MAEQGFKRHWQTIGQVWAMPGIFVHGRRQTGAHDHIGYGSQVRCGMCQLSFQTGFSSFV
eukprot:1352487-Amphidinium_carterae.1